MPARLTQEYVDAWLSEHRPDFVPEPGWVYVGSQTPIPGRCLVEGCGADCSPTLDNMKTHDTGHCVACGDRTKVEKAAVWLRAHAETEVKRVAAERGYEVVDVFMKESSHGKRGMEKSTYAILRCSCGNEWCVSQGSLCSNGTGCPSCAEFGYSTDKPGAMYLLVRTVDGVEQRQFGISNDWKTRTAGYKRFGWRLKDVVIWQDGSVARRHEDRMNALVREVGRTVEPDNVYYRCKEAFVDGVGIPMFVGVHDLLHWLGEDNNA